MIGYIDIPIKNSLVHSNNFICSGWVYSQKGVSYVKIFLDNNEIDNAEYGLFRMDVKAAYPDHDKIENSGFFYKFENISDGEHQIHVKILEKDGNLKELGKIKVNVYSTISPINPKNLQNCRERISFNYINGYGIEIGALHNPLPVKDKVLVKYLDRMSSNELRIHYSELRKYKLVNVGAHPDSFFT